MRRDTGVSGVSMVGDNMNDRIQELEAEIKRLKEELETSKNREQAVEESRRALLFMIEEVNESAESMKRGKKEWEATFDAISDPLFIHDKKFRIIRANKAYSSISGLPFQEIIGKHYFQVFPRMANPLGACANGTEAFETVEEEISVTHLDRVYRLRLYPIKNENGESLYSVHVLEEVTETRRAQERTKEEMEVTTHLLMIADAIAGTTDIDRLMEQVVHCGHKITGCDICLSYLWDKESNAFQPCQEFGLSREFLPLFRTESLDMKAEFVKQAVTKKSPVIEKVGEVREPALQWIADINAIAVIPLIGKKGYLGLIVGIYQVGAGLKPAPTEFTERHIKLMQGISHQVSLALEEASLYKESTDRTMELSHKIETIKVMHEIDRSILSTLASTEILETVTRMIGRLIPCDRATIALVDKERKGFTYEAGFGLKFIQKEELVLFAETSITEVVTTGRPQYVQDIEIVKELLPFEQRLLKDGFLSHIRLPLAVKGEVVAVLSVGAKRPAAFTAESLSTLEYLASQIGVALENSRLVTDLEELFIGTVKSLSSAIDAKSPWTSGHSERVTKYALDIGKEMGLSEKELKQLELAGILHDVGKIGTYEAILDKPERLTPDELNVMRQHPGKGAEILSPIKNLKDMIPAIRHHHEFYDGKGYPDGLKGEEIPLFARILTVADTADAMGADRPYRKGRGMDVIIDELKRCSGTQFDPKVVDVFLKTLQNKPL